MTSRLVLLDALDYLLVVARDRRNLPTARRALLDTEPDPRDRPWLIAPNLGTWRAECVVARHELAGTSTVEITFDRIHVLRYSFAGYDFHPTGRGTIRMNLWKLHPIGGTLSSSTRKALAS